MKSILVIGLGRFGKHLVEKLNELGHQIMAIDRDEERVNDILEYATSAQIGDSTNKNFLETLGVDNYDVCFVTISNDFQGSLITTTYLKELGAKLVVARAERDVQKSLLLRNGADEVIYPEEQVANWAAIKYSSNHVLDYIKLDADLSIFEVPVPENWVGKSIGQIDIRRKYQISILSLKTNGKMNPSVTPDIVFTPGMTLYVLGEFKALQKCFKI